MRVRVRVRVRVKVRVKVNPNPNPNPNPKPERYFKHIMDYTPNSNRFKFELTPQQVADLLNAFKAHDAERPAKA